MATWTEFAHAAPELAERVKARLEAHRHMTIATLRRDGSPRISGTEAAFDDDGQLWIGSMGQALKAKDLRRDPRFALHSGSDEPDEWQGDAKLAGTVTEVATDNDSHRFNLDLTEVSVVALNAEKTHIVIDVWTPDRGVRTITRK